MNNFPINPKFDKIQTLIFSQMPLKRVYIGTTTNIDYKHDKAFSSKFHMLYYIVSGEGEININNVSFHCSAGKTIFIKKKTEYSICSNKSNALNGIFIAFSCNYLSTMIDEYKLTSNVYNIDCAEEFTQFNTITKLPWEKNFSIVLANALHKIISNMPNNYLDTKESSAQDIKQKLNSLLCKKCNLDALAKELNMSKSNIINTFKKTFGITPYQYVLNYKIEVAKEYLKTTTLSIKSIAHILSFESEHYFSHSFTQRVKLSPTEYRDNYSLLNKKQ